MQSKNNKKRYSYTTVGYGIFSLMGEVYATGRIEIYDKEEIADRITPLLLNCANLTQGDLHASDDNRHPQRACHRIQNDIVKPSSSPLREANREELQQIADHKAQNDAYQYDPKAYQYLL